VNLTPKQQEALTAFQDALDRRERGHVDDAIFSTVHSD